MSLIEEALRKQQQLQGREPDKTSRPPEPASDTVPEQPAESVPSQQSAEVPRSAMPALSLRRSHQPSLSTDADSQTQDQAQEPDARNGAADADAVRAPARSKSKFWRSLIVTIVILMLFAGGGWGLRVLWNIFHADSPEVATVSKPPAHAPPAPAEPADPEPDASAAIERPDIEPLPEKPLEADPETPSPVAHPEQEDPQPDLPGQSPAPSEIAVPEPSPQPSPPVIWPDLHLTGILESRGPAGQGSAFINGEIVDLGGTIAGVQLIAVTREGVRLRKGDEIRFLRVGGILE